MLYQGNLLNSPKGQLKVQYLQVCSIIKLSKVGLIDKIIKLYSKRICQRRTLADAPYTQIVYSTYQYTSSLLQIGILEVLNYNLSTLFYSNLSKQKGLKTLLNAAQYISHLLQLKLRRLLFPKGYIILIAGKRGRFVRGRLKNLNSVAIKLIVEVVYIVVRILVRVSVRVSVRGQKRARRGAR